MSQQFCLKWNNHMNNMMDVFKNLLSTEAMVDVTLACDGLSLKAHKIVLSACSPFFQSLFLENPCKHPIVILKDMKYTELKAIIEFMYHGEVNVAQDQLSALMKTAETLRVKGLAEVTNEKNQSGDESSHRSVSRTDTPPPKRRRGRTRKRSLSDQSDASDPKIKQPDSDIEELSGDMDPSTPYSTASTVPLQSHSTNSFHKSQQEQPVEQGADESFAPEEKFGVEPSKLLEQTLTTDDLPRRSGRSSVQSNMELQRRPRSSTDHSTSLVPVTSTPMSSDALANQQPESPPDIKPELLDLEPPMSPVAGPSHSTDENSMMMYMDQSSMSTMPGPSGYQDNSALVSTDSQPQGNVPNFRKIDVSKPGDECKKTLCICSDCNYICGIMRSMKTHKRTCTKEKLSSNERLKKALETMYVCSECDFICTNKNELKLHHTVCNGGKASIACQTIEEDRNRTSSPLVILARPSSSPTTDQDAFPKSKISAECQTDPVKFVRKKDERTNCPHCSYSTTRYHNLKLHIDRHRGEKKFACTFCERKFAVKYDCTMHEKTHTGRILIPCDICNKHFSSKSVLKRHKIRWHTEEKPFVCQICSMGFKFELNLKNHQKTHTQERPFPCEVCFMAFKFKRDLKNHKKTHY